ncbi:MAG TPA: EthD family reductase [Gemmatimonadaceae bacterium]|nr:EthD family reductase [Gemmatimonadaceae bacterium]
MWAVTVIYNIPKDAAAFEKYYAAVHIPLVQARQKEVGFVRADLAVFPRALDGSAPAFYRQAHLWFDSEQALQTGIATPGFAAIGADLANFATGGFVALIARAG